MSYSFAKLCKKYTSWFNSTIKTLTPDMAWQILSFLFSFFHFLFSCVRDRSYLLTDWLTDWLTDSLTDWLVCLGNMSRFRNCTLQVCSYTLWKWEKCFLGVNSNRNKVFANAFNLSLQKKTINDGPRNC